MSGTWLESVPYGGYAGGTPEAHRAAMARVGQSAMAAPVMDQTSTTIALIGGLVLITGGGAAVGWLVAHSKLGALVGALLGLGYSAANLAVNASAIAAENAQSAGALPPGPPGPPGPPAAPPRPQRPAGSPQ